MSLARATAGEPVLILLLSVGITVLATVLLVRDAWQRDRIRFERSVQQAEASIGERLSAYVAMLEAASALFVASDDVDRREFASFVARLRAHERYPGIQGIGYSARVAANEQQRLEAIMRSSGVEEFRLWPEAPGREVHAIVFLEPMDARNRAALGYDMSSEPVRREAMARARDTGLPALTGKVVLVQEIEGPVQPGFLIYVPVYMGYDPPGSIDERRERLLGFVYSPFRAGDLFSAIFPVQARPELIIRVYDGDEPLPDRLLYDNLPENSERERDDRLRALRSLEIAGHEWTLEVVGLTSFSEVSLRSLAAVAAGVGLLVSLLVFRISGSRHRAWRAVDAHRIRLHDSLVQAPALICVVEAADRRISMTSARLLEAVGDEELVGLTLEEARRSLPAELLEPLERVLRQGEQERFADLALELRGRLYYLDVVLQPLRDVSGRVDAVMLFAVDVTEQVVARRDAEDALRLRDEFLSVASHELKTPLTPLLLRLQSLRRDRHGPRERLEERLPQHLDVMERMVRRLAELVNMLLDVSRIRAGRLRLHEEQGVDLAAVAREVLAEFQPEAARVHSELRLDAPEPVPGRWDRTRLQQVLSNLISNALKYGPGAPVTVAVRREGDMARLTVHDEGIGIAEQDLGRIFGRFERAVSDRHYGGLGLGLYITRSLVDAMGGRIHAESIGRRGATLVVELPRGEGGGASQE